MSIKLKNNLLNDDSNFTERKMSTKFYNDVLLNIDNYIIENNIIISNELDKNDKYYKLFPNNVYIIKHYNGKTKSLGCKANQILNPAWSVYDIDKKEIYILMYIEKNTLTKLCIKGYKYIKKTNITWYCHQIGYVCATVYNEKDKSFKYLHNELLTNFIQNDDINLSVDHINRDKLDNRLENLRWASQSLQNTNRDKVSRHKNAREIPQELIDAGITKFPKYITYNYEIYDKEKKSSRSFFRIENHPSYPNTWSSKSNKVNIIDKYNEIIQLLNNFENNINVESIYIYPIGIRYNKEKKLFILDYRDKINSVNYNKKMPIDITLSEENNYENFKKLLIEKYPNFEFKNRD